MRKIVLLTASTLALAVVTASVPQAQQPAPPITQGAANIKRTPVQKFDVPGTNMETVIAIAEIVPNAAVGAHTHPGIESAYVLDGDIVIKITGQPDKALKTGDSWQVPAGIVHDGSAGAKGAKVIVTYVVEKGKPLATPAK